MKKKILILSRYFLGPQIGGSSAHYYSIIRDICFKFDITIAAYSDNIQAINSYYKELPIGLLNLEEFKPLELNSSYFQRLKRNITIFFAVLKLINKNKPTIIISMSLLNTGPFLIIPKFLYKFKLVQTIFGEEIFRDRFFRTYLLRIVLKMLVFINSDLVITNSKFITSYLKIKYKLSARKMRIIQPRLKSDWCKMEVNIDKAKGIRNELGILDNDIVLLSIARHVERKGIHRVIETLYSDQYLNKMANLKYLIAGSGQYSSFYQELIKKYNLEQKVIILGVIPEEYKIHYYDLCDVFILPTFKTSSGDIEGYGLVFLEAMGRKKPVIAGDTGGVSEAIGYGEYGILLKHNYLNSELARAILNLIENKSKCSDIIIKSYDYIIKLPFVESQVDEIAFALKRL